MELLPDLYLPKDYSTLERFVECRVSRIGIIGLMVSQISPNWAISTTKQRYSTISM